MKFKSVVLMLSALLWGCGGSASSEVEAGALPDLTYKTAIELYLRDSVFTGNTTLSYAGEFQLWRKNTPLALTGTDNIRLRDPLSNNNLAYISNIMLTGRCCDVAAAAPIAVANQLVQRPELIFLRAGNIDDSFLLELPPTLLLPEGRPLTAAEFGYKTVGAGTLHFYWTADGYPTEVIVEQLGAICPVGENAVRLVRPTQNNEVFIKQTELGRCTSSELQVTFSRSKAQSYRTSIQTAQVNGTVTVKRQFNLIVF